MHLKVQPVHTRVYLYIHAFEKRKENLHVKSIQNVTHDKQDMQVENVR